MNPLIATLTTSEAHPPGGFTLVAWSGGVDSTALLVSLLQSTDEPILAVHITLDNVEGRASHETEAVMRMRAAMQPPRFRPFRFETFHISWPRGLAIPADIMLVTAVAGLIASNTPVARLALGRCAEDGIQPVRRAVGDLLLTAASHPRRAAVRHNPIEGMTKAQQIALLPDDLREMIWSCRTPTPEGTPCGACRACLDLKAARASASMP